MRVVILCGGRGTWLREETEFRPKPMVPIGGKPILWYMMKCYAHFGHKEFILCLGYKGEMFKEYLAAPARRPCWLRVDRLLGEWGIPKDSAAGRRVFGERMEWQRGEDLRGEFKRVERGWCLGGDEFRQELLEQVDTRPGPSHFGEAVQEAELARGERLVAEGLARLGWSEAELRAHRKGEPGKVELVWGAT